MKIQLEHLKKELAEIVKLCGMSLSLVSFRRFGLAGLLLILALLPSRAAAHPLDEFYQVTFISVAPNRVSMIIELYSGVLVAPTLLPLVDPDGDELITNGEAQAYVDRFIDDLAFQIDGTALRLEPAKLEFPTVLDLRAGIGVIRFQLGIDLPPDHRGPHRLFYENNHLPDVGLYVVNALSDDPQWVDIARQERSLDQRSVELDYVVDPAAPLNFGSSGSTAEIDLPNEVSQGQRDLASYLYRDDLSPLLMMAVIGLSIVLGGLHALTPGHGKTLVAAYLIGSRGTVKHAVFLGGIVTFTHTASVIVIGLLALLASQFIVPNVLVPALEIASGLLVVALGLQLIRARWGSYARPGEAQRLADHDHAYAHRHGLPHHHGPHDHQPDHQHDHHHHSPHHDSDHHDHAPHHHLPPDEIKLGDLLTLGISGGLVPCPEALGIMLIAVGLNRILLGLGMVVAFSFGLAAILIIIGILLVRAGSWLNRLSGAGQRWQALLPLASALIVTLLGFGIMLKGLWPYFQ